jgi:hypothetical protein
MPSPINRPTIPNRTTTLGNLGKAIAIACLSVAGFIAGPPPARADDDGGIRLVTQNMYVGSSFAPLSAAQTPQQLLAAVATTFSHLASTPGR